MQAELVHQKYCKNYTLVTDSCTGEIACSSCGSVFSERITDSGEETALHSRDHHNGSVGQKISLKMIDMGLSTIIESKDMDSTGRILSAENRRMFYRLRMWDRNSRSDNSVKAFQKAFILLDGISSKLALPESVAEHTAYLFRKVAARGILTGRSTSGMLCATAYIACRITNTPRTLQDVAEAGNIKKKNLQRAYRFLSRELQLSPESYDPIEFVTRIANAADISERTERLAFKILNAAAKIGISTSKNPMAMAAAAVNLAANINHEKASLVKISEASGISTVTIRDRTNEIREKTGGEIIG